MTDMSLVGISIKNLKKNYILDEDTNIYIEFLLYLLYISSFFIPCFSLFYLKVIVIIYIPEIRVLSRTCD